MSRTSSGYSGDYPALRGLTQSEQHRLLADARRQLVLDVLSDDTASIGLEELAMEILEREETQGADYEGVCRVQIDLHHKHLPLMDDLGVLDYDPATHLIRTDVSSARSADSE